MKRRRALVAGVAVAAAATGAGIAWRRRGSDSPLPGADFWTLRFDRPGGGQLALDGFRGRPLLLNFWATWCPPCVAELPLLDQFQREHVASGWQVLGLAVDNAAPVTAFLAKHPVTFAIGLAGIGGIELARQLGDRGGALPFTAVFDRSGTLVHRKLGAIDPADLQQWVAAAG